MPRAPDSRSDGWVSARLLPTAGIRGQEEQEKRATSALLAVMRAVPSFGHSLLASLGAPRGEIRSFTEVRLKDGEGKTHIPDGAIAVSRGKTHWSTLIEVKTGRATLGSDQVTRYLEMARQHDFDALMTISNEIVSDSKALPYEVDRRKVGKLKVRHLSWWQILTEAIVESRFRGVDDPDQAWILAELIRYLDDEKSGASGFEGMGEEWVGVREGARNETLRPGDPQARAVAARWEQFIRYLCLQLSQELGVAVKEQRRSKGAEDRITSAAARLAEEGVLRDGIRVPDAVGPLTIEANLRTGRVTTSVDIDAPDGGRPKTRVNWLVRQLSDAPDDLRIDCRFAQRKGSKSELLRDLRDAPERLLLEDDPKREPRSFSIALSRAMGKKRGRTEGSFVSETRKQLVEFYRDLVQDLTPPRRKAPRLAEPEEETPAQAMETEATRDQARKEHESTLRGVAELGAYVQSVTGAP